MDNYTWWFHSYLYNKHWIQQESDITNDSGSARPEKHGVLTAPSTNAASLGLSEKKGYPKFWLLNHVQNYKYPMAFVWGIYRLFPIPTTSPFEIPSYFFVPHASLVWSQFLRVPKRLATRLPICRRSPKVSNGQRLRCHLRDQIFLIPYQICLIPHVYHRFLRSERRDPMSPMHHFQRYVLVHNGSHHGSALNLTTIQRATGLAVHDDLHRSLPVTLQNHLGFAQGTAEKKQESSHILMFI